MMPVVHAAFQETKHGVFQTDYNTADGCSIKVFIDTEGEVLEKNAIDFTREYLSRELQIRRQAASKIYAENDEIKTELGYATAEDLYNALEPGCLTVLWQCHETRMVYLSVLDDLELWGDKHVILVSYNHDLDELEINLERIRQTKCRVKGMECEMWGVRASHVYGQNILGIEARRVGTGSHTAGEACAACRRVSAQRFVGQQVRATGWSAI